MFSAKLEMGARDPTYFANKQRAIFYTRMYCHGTRPSFFSARHNLQCMQTSHGAANMPMSENLVSGPGRATFGLTMHSPGCAGKKINCRRQAAKYRRSKKEERKKRKKEKKRRGKEEKFAKKNSRGLRPRPRA